MGENQPSKSTGGLPLLRNRYKREIESSPDPDARRAEIEASLQAIASPFRTAEATGQDIIDPRDTRLLLVGSFQIICCITEKTQILSNRGFSQQSSSRMPRPCCARSSARRACPTCREALWRSAPLVTMGTSSVPDQGALFDCR